MLYSINTFSTSASARIMTRRSTSPLLAKSDHDGNPVGCQDHRREEPYRPRLGEPLDKVATRSYICSS